MPPRVNPRAFRLPPPPTSSSGGDSYAAVDIDPYVEVTGCVAMVVGAFMPRPRMGAKGTAR